SPGRGAAACRATHVVRAPSAGRPALPRRGGGPVRRSARACARHWRGIHPSPDRSTMSGSPMRSPLHFLRREVALAELGRQWRENRGETAQFGTAQPSATFLCMRPENLGATRGAFAMRKVHLLTTVAASLLIATAAMAADNNEQKSKGEMSNPAPAAQQQAPAEKIAPPMQAGQ